MPPYWLYEARTVPQLRAMISFTDCSVVKVLGTFLLMVPYGGYCSSWEYCLHPDTNQTYGFYFDPKPINLYYVDKINTLCVWSF